MMAIITDRIEIINQQSENLFLCEGECFPNGEPELYDIAVTLEGGKTSILARKVAEN